MSINLTVRAEVIDIRTDTPQPTDILLVDTNVWLWQTYGLPPKPDPKQSSKKEQRQAQQAEQKLKVYTRYLNAALSRGIQLKYCGLILAELAHVIERTEFEIFKRRNKLNSLSAKAYRHNYPIEHGKVASLISSAWSQITMLASSADLMVDEELADRATTHFYTVALDGYDLFLFEAIRQTGIKPVQILTDDMDYATVPNIQLFTSNGRVIQCAADQKQLISRGQ
ncbi:MAG: hypothetical protein ACFB0E_01795 [Leptolyngbyaceae cyanobacterium]